MIIVIKKYFLSVFFALFLACPLYSQEGGGFGKLAPADFSWSTPKKSDMSFRLVSLDDKPRSFFVKKEGFYAPVSMAGRSLGELYSVSGSKQLVLYANKPVPGTPEGMANFVPVLVVDTGGSEDIIVGVYGKDQDSLRGLVLDVSLQNMPLGSFTLINFNPEPLGFKIGNATVRLNFFEHKTIKLGDSAKTMAVSVDTFALKNPRAPEFVSNKSYSFWGDRRMLVFFLQPIKAKVESIVPGLFGDNPPPSAIGPSDSFFVTDKGPR